MNQIFTIEDLKLRSLNEVERLWRAGCISETLATEYVRLWNTGPHLTQCVIWDGAFRTFDPERSSALYRYLKDEFNLQLQEAK
jgi:hypothetical protein